jgi:hypothetical protein
MADNYEFGRSADDLLGGSPKYFYALRRTDDGELYFTRINQLSRTDSVQINNDGTTDGDFLEFEAGVDFFEGRDANHDLVFENLNFEQMRWDNRNLYYYIDANGQLCVRTDTKYPYPSGI